ncbi:MAG: RidA family protein [Dongiaceae bacterium]
MTRFDPPELWRPFGPFSMGVVQGDGRIVHLKGQVALDRQGKVVGAGDMRAQLQQVFENIRQVLAHVGGEMTDIISLTHYVTDITRFTAASDLRRSWFTTPYPVTSTVQVAALYRPDLMVEIAAIAEIPRDRFRQPQG